MLAEFEKAASLPDAAWIAGMLWLRRAEFVPARRRRETALGGLDRLGSLPENYGIAAEVTCPVTPEVDAQARPRERGTRLALVEIPQFDGDRPAAMSHVERLPEIEPGDPVVLLSFAELTLEGDADRAQMERVVALRAAKVAPMLTSRPRLSNRVRIAIPSGPVVRATAAMALTKASSAGAAATASWFESPRQIRPRREIASLVRSIWRASWSETTTPKSRISCVACRSMAVSIRVKTTAARSPKSCEGEGHRPERGALLRLEMRST